MEVSSNTPTTTITDSIAKMRGGPKAKWIRENRDFLLTCLDLMGADFVKAKFGLSERTLNEFTRIDKSSNPFKETHKGLSVDSDVMNEFAHRLQYQNIEIVGLKTQVNDLRKEVQELEALWGSFTETVSRKISAAVISPLVGQLCQPNRELRLTPKPDILSLEDMFEDEQDPLLPEARKLAAKLKGNITPGVLRRRLRVGIPRAKAIIEKINSEANPEADRLALREAYNRTGLGKE